MRLRTAVLWVVGLYFAAGVLTGLYDAHMQNRLAAEWQAYQGDEAMTRQVCTYNARQHGPRDTECAWPTTGGRR